MQHFLTRCNTWRCDHACHPIRRHACNIMTKQFQYFYDDTCHRDDEVKRDDTDVNCRAQCLLVVFTDACDFSVTWSRRSRLLNTHCAWSRRDDNQQSSLWDVTTLRSIQHSRRMKSAVSTFRWHSPRMHFSDILHWRYALLNLLSWRVRVRTTVALSLAPIAKVNGHVRCHYFWWHAILVWDSSAWSMRYRHR